MASWYKNVIYDYLRNKWLLILFVLIFFCAGIFSGAVATKMLSIDQAEHLSAYFNGFLEKVTSVQSDQQFYLRYSVLNNFYVMLAIGVLGLTIVGIPFILVALFSRGFILGFTVGFLVREKAVKGFLFALISVLPHNLLAIPAVLIGSVTALSFSLFLIKRRFMSGKIPYAASIGGYAAIMLLLCVVTGLAGLVETYVTPVIIRSAASYMI